jgi:hypothetical protein
MDRSAKNIAASSVHQRLLSKAKESSRPFNEMLKHFTIKRFVYRLSKSLHADTFVLKEALAEKYQAMVKLGMLNIRMKDFYDIWFLSRRFDFNGETLVEAIERRKTPLTSEPTIFTLSFMSDDIKQVQWQGFTKKKSLPIHQCSSRIP